MRNIKLIAGIALALGGVGSAYAAAPTPTACASPTAVLYVGGSSAAKDAFAQALATDLFGGPANEAAIVSTGGTGDFAAYCGVTTKAISTNVPVGSTVVIHYRAEGGSVVGVLPVKSNKAIKYIDLVTNAAAIQAQPAVNGASEDHTTTPWTNPNCPKQGQACYEATVAGSSATVGTTDGWTGMLTTHAVELGVADVEATQFAYPNFNYPVAYSTAAFGGPYTVSQFGSMPKVAAFQQVFGIFVNNTGGAMPATMNLSKETIHEILVGNYSDWSAVPTATGGAVASSSVAIKLCNRESGSGTKTVVGAYFLGYGCPGNVNTTHIFDPTWNSPSSTDSYATGDALSCANATPGALTYASIDNNGKKPNLTMVQLSGVTPSALAAATGQYDFWYEAQFYPNATALAASSLFASDVETYAIGALPAYKTAPSTAQIVATPNAAGNSATVPLTSDAHGSGTVYINPFTRSANSCSVPAEQN